MNDRNPAQQSAGKKHFLRIFVAAFLTAVLLLGAVLFTVSAVQKSRYAVRYENTGVNEKTLAYLALYTKQSYLAELHSSGILNAADTETFWASLSGDGTSYGELLNRKIREYVGRLLIAASIFDRASSLGKDGKEKIRSYVEERITYIANGSEKEYNEAVKVYGFDRKSAEQAVTLQYKAKYALTALYGADCSGIAEETYYLSTVLNDYIHVDLFYVDADDETALSAVRTAIAGSETEQISPYQFETLKERYDTSGEDEQFVSAEDGFYFREGTAYTEEYASYYPEVVEKALSMEMGDYAEVSCSKGVCFLYRYAVTASAYSSSVNEEFFSDFYSVAASLLFSQTISGLRPGVGFTAKYDAERLIALPYDGYYQYYVRF